MPSLRKIGLVSLVVILVLIYVQRNRNLPQVIPLKEEATTPISPPSTKKPSKRGRYLRIKRTSGNEVINIAAMSASFEGIPYRPVNGEVKPLWGTFVWQNLVDDNPETFAHTQPGICHILLDLGMEYPVDRISVLNRNEKYTGEDAKHIQPIRDRIIGSILTLEDASMNVIWQHEFTLTGERWTFDL